MVAAIHCVCKCVVEKVTAIHGMCVLKWVFLMLCVCVRMCVRMCILVAGHEKEIILLFAPHYCFLSFDCFILLIIIHHGEIVEFEL